MATKKNSAPKRITKLLPVDLTTEEKLARTQDMVSALSSVDDLQKKKSEQTAEINAEIKLARRTVKLLQEVVKDGVEMRDVECIEVHDFSRNTVIVRRSDKKPNEVGAVVEERSMTAEERQTELPGLGAPTASTTPKPGPGAPIATVAEIAEARAKRNGKANGKGHDETPAEEAPKRRGRPPGSKAKAAKGVVNPDFADFAETAPKGEAIPTPKRRGRPPGSKNKPKSGAEARA